MILSSNSSFRSSMLCGLYLRTCPIEKILDGVVFGRFGRRDLYIETQSSKVVAKGFSHIICRPRGANPTTTSLCCSSNTQMNAPSTPAGTSSPLLAFARLSNSHFRNALQSSNPCPSVGPALPQMYFSPSCFRLYATGSATATIMPFVDSAVALAYALPREPAPMMRSRGGFADMAGRGGAGRDSPSSTGESA